ncbi:MAG: histidine phosphatase family protein [Burkholderiaceae bacterium]
MAETELILIRHGVTTWNQQGRFQGCLDIGLADEGHVQARLTGERLASTPLSAVYASDLSRALQTAAPIARAQSLDVVPDPGFRERHYGDFQGFTGEQISERDPLAWQRWRARDADFVLPGGGESLRQFYERVRDALHRVADRHPGESVAIVTHGGVLDCVYRLGTGMALSAPRRHDLLNASLNRIAWDGQRFTVREWADVAHLPRSIDDR